MHAASVHQRVRSLRTIKSGQQRTAHELVMAAGASLFFVLLFGLKQGHFGLPTYLWMDQCGLKRGLFILHDRPRKRTKVPKAPSWCVCTAFNWGCITENAHPTTWMRSLSCLQDIHKIGCSESQPIFCIEYASRNTFTNGT